MKRRSLLLILLIVLLPIGLLTWLGLRVARDEQAMTQQRFRAVMEQRLQDVNRVVRNQFQATERRLRDITAVDSLEIDVLRETVRREPQVTQLFVLAPDGSLLYPNPADALNGTELSFLRQASRMFTDRDLHSAVAQTEAERSSKDFQKVQPAGQLQNDTQSGLLGGPIFPEILIAASEQEGLAQQTADASRMSAVSGTGGAGTRSPGNVSEPAARADALAATDRDPAPAAAPAADTTIERADSGVADQSVAMLSSAVDDEVRQSEAGGVSGAMPGGESSNAPALAQRNAATVAATDLADVATDAAVPQFRAAQKLAAKSGADPNPMPPAPPVGQLPAAMELQAPFPPSSGWFVWYWDRGMNLVYWQRRPSGHIVGAALERSRWIADLIAVLPDTDAKSDVAESPAGGLNEGFRVVSSSAESVYEWGLPISATATPFCEVPLASPLASWRMQCFVPAEQLMAGTGRRAFLTAIGGLSVVTITLSSLAWLLYRDYSRDMREAGQQVSFVNQVSHELKTPLTNIRMYAELLERDLDQVPVEQSVTPRKRLDVITTEAQRLSRLIGNVLTFARQQRQTLQLQPTPVNPAELIRHIVDRFTPSLAEHGLTPAIEATDCRELKLDPDFIEQILGNLISNVEKYAASGKLLTIRCRCDAAKVTIDVIDAGPGIPAAQKDDVFRPFARLSNDLRASTGTGIGLSIARDLARLHGGDLTLVETPTGCCFRTTLAAVT